MKIDAVGVFDTLFRMMLVVLLLVALWCVLA